MSKDDGLQIYGICPSYKMSVRDMTALSSHLGDCNTADAPQHQV